MIAQSVTSHRQEMAQNGCSGNCLLANELNYTIVEVVSGVIIPAQFTDYLFRTPSLSGQAFVDDDCLPTSFGAHDEPVVRHRSADSCGDRAFELQSRCAIGQLHASTTSPVEGGARCEQELYGLRCRSARAFRPVATRLANRRCTGLARASSERRFCKEASLAAWSSVPQAMSCTVSKNRAAVVECAQVRADVFSAPDQCATFAAKIPDRRARLNNSRAMRRTACETLGWVRNARKGSRHHSSIKTSVLHHPPRPFAERAGPAPAKSKQSKDSPCSTRS